MTPRVHSGQSTGKTELIQEDISPEEMLTGKVPQKSARNFLLCIAKSPLEQYSPEDDSPPDEETVIH